jgi:hypothetical protein
MVTDQRCTLNHWQSLYSGKRGKKKKTQNQGSFDFQKLQKPETRGHYKIKELP